MTARARACVSVLPPRSSVMALIVWPINAPRNPAMSDNVAHRPSTVASRFDRRSVAAQTGAAAGADAGADRVPQHEVDQSPPVGRGDRVPERFGGDPGGGLDAPFPCRPRSGDAHEFTGFADLFEHEEIVAGLAAAGDRLGIAQHGAESGHGRRILSPSPTSGRSVTPIGHAWLAGRAYWRPCRR